MLYHGRPAATATDKVFSIMATPNLVSNSPLTVAMLAKAKLLPVEFLRELGLSDLPRGGVGIPYLGPTGEEIAVKRRTALKAADGSYWPTGKPLAAYGLWRLDLAAKAGFLILVEGESDCWALWRHGLPALGLPGASTAKTLLREHVETVESVYIHREPDKGGATFVRGASDRLAALGYTGKAFELRMPSGVKDPADLHILDPAQFKPRLEAAIRDSARLELTRGAASNGGASAVDGEAAGLATTCLATVRVVPVRWLVPGYLPLGKLVLLAGDGGHGKSTLTLDLGACLTTGRPCLGLDYEPLPPSDVLLISCEDDYADTIVPRLLSAGADLARIHKVDGIRGKQGRTEPFSLSHYQSMEAELQARPNIRLVVIDPAGAYVGRSGVDDYNDSELRSLLGPMAELAARRQVTMVLVKHLVKGATAKAVHKVGGSAGYVNTVRAAFVVAPDKEDGEKKLLLPLKFNLGPRPSALAYRMGSLDAQEQRGILDSYAAHLDAQDQERLAKQLFHIGWLGPVVADAESVLADQTRRQRTDKSEEAGTWLQQFLSEHAYPSEEILSCGREAGFSRNALFAVKKELGIRASNRVKGVGGPWYWGLGDPSTWKVRSDSDGTHGTVGTLGKKPAENGLHSRSVPSVPSVPLVEGEL